MQWKSEAEVGKSAWARKSRTRRAFWMRVIQSMPAKARNRKKQSTGAPMMRTSLSLRVARCSETVNEGPWAN